MYPVFFYLSLSLPLAFVVSQEPPFVAHYIQSNKPGPHQSCRPWQQVPPGEQTNDRNPISADSKQDMLLKRQVAIRRS